MVMVQQIHAGHAWTERELNILSAVFKRHCGSLLQHETRGAAFWVWTGCQVYVQMKGGDLTLRHTCCGYIELPLVVILQREDSRAGHLVASVSFHDMFVL